MDMGNSGAAALLDGGAGGAGGDGAGDGGGDGAAAAAAAVAASAAAAGGGDDAAAALAAAGGGDGGQDPDWYDQISADVPEGESASLRDWLKSKGVKDINGLTKSYRDAEKGLRDSGRIKVPGEGATDEERASFHKAIGVPDDVTGYEVKMPETTGGLELDSDMVGKLADIAHKSGVPKGGFEAIANAYVESQVAAHLERVQREDQGRDAILTEWGASKDQKIAEANAAMRTLDLSKSDVAAMQAALGTPDKAGSARVLEILQKIGAGIAEDVLSTGGSGRFGITASEARGQLDTMKADPEVGAKAMQPGTPENLRWNRLLEIIGAEEARKQAGG
jgi:hypothetical protein